MGNYKKSLTIVFIGILALSVTSSLYAFGSREVPQIQVQTPSPWYLSPTGTSPTAKHSASVTVSVRMSMKSKSGYIPEYSVSIVNSSGKVIKDIVKKQKPDLGFFARLFSSRKSFTIDKTISWDGTDNAGNTVADGQYTAKLTVLAQDGTKQTSTIGTFVVDTQSPSVTISAPNGLVFNPKGNGKNRSLKIDQSSGSVEKLWTGTFYNSSGDAVKSFTWTDSAPQSFAWDGRDNAGNLLPDGHYTYKITSTDQAGNQAPNYQISDIILNTEKTPLSLALSNPYFSPNGDGIKDTTTIDMSTQSKVPVVSWSLSINNPSGTVVRSFGGQGSFPSQEVFNGEDTSGTTLPDATYTVTFDVTFQNGNEGVATAPVVINVTKPPLAIAYSNPAFSPNGDGSKDTTTAMLSLTSGEPVSSWSLEVKDAAGNVVRNVTGNGTPPTEVVFDGKNQSGQTLPDGTYTGVYHVTLADGMSNSTEKSVVIDTVAPKVALSVSTTTFMPNSAGSDNTETISFTSDEPVTWTGELVDNQNQVLLKTQQPMSVTRVVLTKADPVVAQASAGLYVLNLTFEDAAGNTYSPSPANIELFTHPISTNISVAASGFSPLAPAGSNTIAASLSTDTPAGIDSYKVSVMDQSNTSVGSFTVQGPLQNSFTWNGTFGSSGANNYPPDGTYRLRLTTHYTNGLTSSGESQPFLVDVTPPQIAGQSTSSGPFIVTANGQDLQGTISGSLAISDTGRSISSWTVSLVDPSGATIKSASGTGEVNQSLTASGTFPLGGPVPTAVTTIDYQANVTATDQYGNTATTTVNLPLRTIARVENGRIHLLVPHLLFGPYKYALNSKSAEQGRANEQTLSLVADILKSYPSYNIELDGYSMEIYAPSSRYYNSQENIIVPLSKNRADIARTSLVQLGIPASRIFARYWGGMNTLVDPHNVDLRWMNRRVEFILLPQGTQPATEPSVLVRRFETATGASSGN